MMCAGTATTVTFTEADIIAYANANGGEDELSTDNIYFASVRAIYEIPDGAGGLMRLESDYGHSEGATPDDLETITRHNEVVLPEVARAMMDSTNAAIERRVGEAGARASRINLGGVAMNMNERGMDDVFADTLQRHGTAASDGGLDLQKVLADSDFVIALNDEGYGIGAASLWGSGDHRSIRGDSNDLKFEGEMSGAHLGWDSQLREDVFAGVALSVLSASLDWEDSSDDGEPETGQYDNIDLTSVNPYVAWSSGAVDMWATLGYGTGDIEYSETDDDDVAESEINMTSFGFGSAGKIWQDGNANVRLKGQAQAASMEVEGSETMAELSVDATRLRVSVEAVQYLTLDNGGIYEPSLELGVRMDGGDGETGSGAEIGGSLKYTNTATGFSADFGARALVGHSGNAEEWGIHGTIGVVAGKDGQGFTLNLKPGYGDTGSDLAKLWADGVVDDATTTDATENYHAKLDAEFGYGFKLRGIPGVLTPYSEATLSTTDRYRMGVKWQPVKYLDLNLSGEQSGTENAIRLEGVLGW